jgi:hypothetical protein
MIAGIGVADFGQMVNGRKKDERPFACCITLIWSRL